jgi:hypothetical protein
MTTKKTAKAKRGLNLSREVVRKLGTGGDAARQVTVRRETGMSDTCTCQTTVPAEKARP